MVRRKVYNCLCVFFESLTEGNVETKHKSLHMTKPHLQQENVFACTHGGSSTDVHRSMTSILFQKHLFTVWDRIEVKKDDGTLE